LAQTNQTQRPSLTRFERQEPWVPSEHSQLQVALWQFLSVSSLVFGTWYLYWRWAKSINMEAAWFSVPLAIAETLAFIGLALYTINLWSPAAPKPGALPASAQDVVTDPGAVNRPLVVDIFFATYNEDPELVRRGLQDAKKVTYPLPIDIRINVLDDGRRPKMQQVAVEEGVNYVTRSDNVGFKAGNMRNAMEVTVGDFIVICDADTRLFPDFLVETMGYFRDPDMAWVQTPQWFWDIPPGVPLEAWLRRRLGRPGGWIGRIVERAIGPVRLGEDPFGNDPQMFYDFIQHRRNWANASFCCGAASIHRREALMEAAIRAWASDVEKKNLLEERASLSLTGELDLYEAVRDNARVSRARETDFAPFKLHVSEDLYTSIHLHSDTERRWKSVMHPKVLSRMMSPSDLLTWTIQRFKYAGGTLDILWNDNPLFRKGLSLPQRLMYATTFYSYLSPIWNIIFVIAPIVFLTTGIAPLATYSLDFLLHLVPFLILHELAQVVGLWGTSVMRGRRWYMAMFTLNFRALWAVARQNRISFSVTPKDRASGKFHHLVRWQIALAIAIVASLLVGWISFLQGVAGFTVGAIIANTLWSVNNLLSLSVIIRAAGWSPDPEFDLPVMKGYPTDAS